MTPGWLSALARCNGWQAPDPGEPLRMLDIGCGDGVGLALIAASDGDAVFDGNDGMPDHIARGQTFARDVPNLQLTWALFEDARAIIHARLARAGVPVPGDTGAVQ